MAVKLRFAELRHRVLAVRPAVWGLGLLFSRRRVWSQARAGYTRLDIAEAEPEGISFSPCCGTAMKPKSWRKSLFGLVGLNFSGKKGALILDR